MTMSTKAPVIIQRKKPGERQGRNATGTFRIREPRSPLPYKQAMSLFCPTRLCKAGVTCSWLCSASRLQGRKGQCPATLVPSPRPGENLLCTQVCNLLLTRHHPAFLFLPPTPAITLPMPWILPSQPWSVAAEGAPGRTEMVVLPP